MFVQSKEPSTSNTSHTQGASYNETHLTCFPDKTGVASATFTYDCPGKFEAGGPSSSFSHMGV